MPRKPLQSSAKPPWYKRPRTVLPIAGAAAVGAGLWYLARRSGPLPTGATIFTIVFENKDASQVLGTGNAPFFDALTRQYAATTNYSMGLHPSLPNYLMMTSGQTFGVDDDGSPSVHPLATRENLFAQLDAARIPWRAYAEGMPEPCYATNHGSYLVRHNPAVYYDSVREDPSCAQRVLPFSSIWDDLQTKQLRYVWITPDRYNDMHDPPDGTPSGERIAAEVAAGDAWLAQTLPRLQATAGYRRGGVIFILFDEGKTVGTTLRTIPAIVVSERVKGRGKRDSRLLDHRAYLAGVQDLLGLPRLPATRGMPSLADVLR